MEKNAFTSPVRVYIADDSEAIRQRLVEAISEIQGVEIVGQGGSAVNVALEVIHLKPDVVILDIHMPGGSSFDVLREIKPARASHPAVICMTASDIKQYRWKYLAGGADYFFSKSTDFEKIIETLRDLASGAR